MASYTVSVFGSGGVGKSCLTLQFVQGIFVTKYDPTIEDGYKTTIEVDEKQYNLEIFDTAGTDAFSTVRDFYIKDSQGFLLVYSITSKATFNEIEIYYDQIIDFKDITEHGSPAIVLIGNKTDLEEQRVVSREDGQALARKWNCTFLETSAKDRSNVIEAFYDLVRQINRKSQVPRTTRSTFDNNEQSEARVKINREHSAATSNAQSGNKTSRCCFLF